MEFKVLYKQVLLEKYFHVLFRDFTNQPGAFTFCLVFGIIFKVLDACSSINQDYGLCTMHYFKFKGVVIFMINFYIQAYISRLLVKNLSSTDQNHTMDAFVVFFEYIQGFILIYFTPIFTHCSFMVKNQLKLNLWVLIVFGKYLQAHIKLFMNKFEMVLCVHFIKKAIKRENQNVNIKCYFWCQGIINFIAFYCLVIPCAFINDLLENIVNFHDDCTLQETNIILCSQFLLLNS